MKKLYQYSTFKIIVLFLLVFISSEKLFSQQNLNVRLSNDKYYTDEKGNILININIWGHVKSPGNNFFYDGIDIITALSVVGGLQKGANLKKIKLIRYEEDENQKKTYNINLMPYYNSGDRSNFPKLKPNDTIIVEETLLYSMFTRSSLTTILQIVNIYLQISRD